MAGMNGFCYILLVRRLVQVRVSGSYVITQQRLVGWPVESAGLGILPTEYLRAYLRAYPRILLRTVW